MFILKKHHKTVFTKLFLGIVFVFENCFQKQFPNEAKLPKKMNHPKFNELF